MKDYKNSIKDYNLNFVLLYLLFVWPLCVCWLVTCEYISCVIQCSILYFKLQFFSKTQFCFLRVRLPPRNASLRKEVFGLVKGADVVRGPHWHFQDQDGKLILNKVFFPQHMPIVGLSFKHFYYIIYNPNVFFQLVNFDYEFLQLQNIL